MTLNGVISQILVASRRTAQKFTLAISSPDDFLLLWSPYVIGQTIIFLPCGFCLLSSFLFPRLISAVGDWMSAILPHMVWP